MPDLESQFLDARTGAKRQSELVRLIAAALRDLADHRGANGG